MSKSSPRTIAVNAPAPAQANAKAKAKATSSDIPAPRSSKGAAGPKTSRAPAPKIPPKQSAAGRRTKPEAPITAIPVGSAAAENTSAVHRGKLGQVITLLEQPDGVTLIDLMAATGWQAHSVRGALSTLKKRLGRPLNSTLRSDGLRHYRLDQA